MTPFETIEKLYQEYPLPRSFDEDIAAHFRTGHVFTGRDFFIMGRPIERGAAPALIENPWHRFENPDCWLVYAAAGLVKTMLDFIPYPLHWVAFQRRGNPLRYYDFNTLARRLRQQDSSHAILFRGRISSKAPQAREGSNARDARGSNADTASSSSASRAPSHDQ